VADAGATHTSLVIGDVGAFLAVATIVIVTPGQDTALTIRNTLIGRRRAGIFTAVGVSSGQAVWALATSVGLAALLAASEPAFLALKLAGAAYLVWLGLQSLRSAWRGTRRTEHQAVRKDGLRPLVAWRQGALSNLGNPKMAVFFVSLLPQFAGSFGGVLLLGLLFSALTFTWLSAYATVVARAGETLRRPAIRRTLDAVTGLVLVGLGLRLGTERR
jgi:threonine/homoserine/homoserine lactone efflux protein